jgi:hypothetical protein
MRVFGSKMSPVRQKGLRFLRKVANEFAVAYEERAASEKGLMFAIAKDLEVNRSAIYRRLAGDANMTATTIGELAAALGLKPNERLFVPDVAEQGSNGLAVIEAISRRPPSVVATTSGPENGAAAGFVLSSPPTRFSPPRRVIQRETA